MKIFGFFSHPSSQAGWSGTILYWIFENHEIWLGAVVSVCVAISSVAYHWYKVVAIKNEERRREERHQQELSQDKERHERDINSKKNGK